jgi:hypothetical protein
LDPGSLRCSSRSSAHDHGDFGLETTFEIFDSIVAAIALLVAFQAWRTRPAGGPATSTATRSATAAVPERRPARGRRHAAPACRA